MCALIRIRVAVVLSVELCSLTIQRDDVSMANLISAGLFGDGAAAVIVAGADCGLSGPAILATRSVFYPDTEEMMGWDILKKAFVLCSPAKSQIWCEKILRTMSMNFGRTWIDSR